MSAGSRNWTALIFAAAYIILAFSGRTVLYYHTHIEKSIVHQHDDRITGNHTGDSADLNDILALYDEPGKKPVRRPENKSKRHAHSVSDYSFCKPVHFGVPKFDILKVTLTSQHDFSFLSNQFFSIHNKSPPVL